MKKYSIITGLLILFFSNTCSGQLKRINNNIDVRSYPIAYNGYDFTPYLDNFRSNSSTDSTNIINFEMSYFPNQGNKHGYGIGFMIHKYGIKWWFNFAQTRYRKIGELDGINYGYAKASKKLQKEDTALLIDFDKWISFYDKQYLEPVPADGELDYNDPNRDKPRPDNYLPRDSNTRQWLLYQPAGERVWYVLDSDSHDGILKLRKQMVELYGRKKIPLAPTTPAPTALPTKTARLLALEAACKSSGLTLVLAQTSEGTMFLINKGDKPLNYFIVQLPSRKQTLGFLTESLRGVEQHFIDDVDAGKVKFNAVLDANGKPVKDRQGFVLNYLTLPSGREAWAFVKQE